MNRSFAARLRAAPAAALVAPLAATLAALLLPACTGGGAPAACALDRDCGDPGLVCIAGGCAPSKVLCPTLQPTFASINANLFKVGCFKASDPGSKTLGCHDSDASSLAVSKLDLQTSPFTALLGQDGKGALAAAGQGRPAGLLLVKPGDPASSFLLQKLEIATSTPQLGAGMPPDAPRAVCDDATAAVRAWIAQGAKGP